MPNHRTRRAAALSSLALALVAPGLSGQKTWTDPKHGFELKIPRDFNSVPINMDEKWVVAKFLYKRELEGRGMDGAGWVSMPPDIRVIVFPKVDVKDVVAARQRKEEEAAKDRKVINVLEYLQNPFRNYEEYLKENYRNGGWFVVEQKDTKVGGMPAVWKLMEVEEKAGSGAKVYLVAWEIDFGDAVYVVQCQCLKEHEQKLRAAFDGAAGSCKKIPRTEALRDKVTGGTPLDAETKAELGKRKELVPEERRKAREADLARAKDKALSTLPADWKSFSEGPFLFLYHVDLRFAKRVAEQGVAMWSWMNKSFGFLGQDFPVGSIVRICKSRMEASAYVDTSSRSSYNYSKREIVVYDDNDWTWDESAGYWFNQDIAIQFIADKNNRLWWSLPPWLDFGLLIYIGSLKCREGKLIARPDEWDMEAIRTAIREDKFKPSKTILTVKYDSYKAGGRDTSDRVQSVAIVHFLMEKGSSDRRYKNLIRDYVGTLDKKLRELWKMADDRNDKEAKAKDTAEEERERWRAEFRAKADKIFEECFEVVFGKWSDQDWDDFDQAWRRAYKKG